MFSPSEDKGALAKLVEAIKTNYNDRYEEVSLHLSLLLITSTLVKLTIDIKEQSAPLEMYIYIFPPDPSSLGRWYHGPQIHSPHRKAGEGKGQGTGHQAWLNCLELKKCMSLKRLVVFFYMANTRWYCILKSIRLKIYLQQSCKCLIFGWLI